jgi:hypothetical protein
MAAHGTPEYSSATGNDYPAHEQMYRTFTTLVLISIILIANVCIGLTVGGVKGNWWFGGLYITVAVVTAAVSVITESKMPNYVMLVIGLLGLAFA